MGGDYLDLNKSINETELQYIWRLGLAKDSGELDLTWDELADIFNRNLREDETSYYSSSAYRKKYQMAKMFKDEVFSQDNFNTYDLEEQRRELEKAKMKLRDERTAYAKSNRDTARLEENFDLLSEKLQEIGRVSFGNYQAVQIDGDSSLLIILSDWHIGSTFSSAWGEYNANIARDRLNQLLKEIRVICERHRVQDAYISIQGDMINNSIHKSIAITNRENTIEQTKIAIELLSSFIFEVSKIVSLVYVTNVSGNHSRLDKKDDALHNERFDDLIGWTVERLFNSVSNVEFLKTNMDIGIASMNIRGKEYINLHGDYDAFSKSGLANLCLMIGHIPYAVTFGHLHTCAVDDMQGVKMIRGGSLSGSGDDYTVERRLKGFPSQMVCVCTDRGVECFYPIELR